MRVKICGITRSQQGKEICALGATALGFICVERSPRYINPELIRSIVVELPDKIDKIGVFAGETAENIAEIVDRSLLTGIQLHGAETPDFCSRLRLLISPKVEIIKAFRIKTSESLAEVNAYNSCVDTFLLDAYHPQMLGGTGQTLDWQDLQQFKPDLPWILAGGLTPENIVEALGKLSPDGVDLSSGVERSPGNKDLARVTKLFARLNS